MEKSKDGTDLSQAGMREGLPWEGSITISNMILFSQGQFPKRTNSRGQPNNREIDRYGALLYPQLIYFALTLFC